MKSYICFACKRPFSAEHLPEGKYSAYGMGCLPAPPDWHGRLTGNRCACNACHEVFSTPRTFASHQTVQDGTLTCLDPRRMFDRKNRRKLVLTTRGWAKNPIDFNTFVRQER